MGAMLEHNPPHHLQLHQLSPCPCVRREQLEEKERSSKRAEWSSGNHEGWSYPCLVSLAAVLRRVYYCLHVGYLSCTLSSVVGKVTGKSEGIAKTVDLMCKRHTTQRYAGGRGN